jgi:hypothetical protein
LPLLMMLFAKSVYLVIVKVSVASHPVALFFTVPIRVAKSP